MIEVGSHDIAEMRQQLQERVEAAEPIETLSERGDKLLQVVETEDDQLLVTRNYTEAAVADIERGLFVWDAHFPDAWNMMQRSMAAAEIPVVQSVLLENVNEYPFVIVSEYIEGTPLPAAPQEVKQEAAHGLGRLMLVNPNKGFVPHTTVINKDMFIVGERDGRQTAILTDVDPYIHIKPAFKAEEIDADYIDKVGEILWDEWCTEAERYAVFGAFITEIADVALDNFSVTSLVSGAFGRFQLMQGGVDSRKI